MLVLLIILLLLTPELIRWRLISDYQARGADQVTIENVDFNPFTGRLMLQGISIKTDSHTDFSAQTIEATISWSAFLYQDIVINAVRTEQIHIKVRKIDKHWRIAGIKNWAAKRPTTPWYLRRIILGQINLQTTTLTLIQDQIQNSLNLKTIHLTGLNTRAYAKESELTMNGTLDGADIEFKVLLDVLKISPRIIINARLANAKLKKINQWLPNELQFNSGDVDLTVNASLSFNNVLALKGQYQSKISMSDVSIKTTNSKMDALAGVVSINGDLNYEVGIPARLTYKAVLDSKFDQGTLSLTSRKNTLELNKISGNAQIKLDNTEAQISGALQVAHARSKVPLSHIESFNAYNIDIPKFSFNQKSGFKTDQVNSGAIILSRKFEKPETLLEQYKQNLQAKKASAQSISWSAQQGLTIQKLSLSQSVLFALREKQPWPKPQLPSQCLNKPARTITPFKINEVQLLKGSEIHIVDSNFTPAFVTVIQLENAIVKNIDSRSIDSKADYNFSGIVNEYTKFRLIGDIKAFHPKINMNMNATIDELVLQKYTDYFNAFYGYALTAGHLDYKGTYTVNDNNLDANNRFVFTRLGIKNAQSENPNPHTKKSTIPVSLLNFLASNEKNQIKPLPYRMQIDLCDPKVRISDYFILAITTAIKPAVQFFVRYTNPVGQVITVFQKTTKMINQFKLNHIKFSPGSSFLGYSARKNMRKLGDLLIKKPKLTVKLCPRYTKSDLEHYMNESNTSLESATLRATTLGKQRGAKVKKYLIEKMNIKSKRLFVCEPKILESDSASTADDSREPAEKQSGQVKPRVELYL